MSGYLQNFDLTHGINILRLICGLFFIPHIYAKFFVPEALGFFVAAKFRPPAGWMYTACVIETFLAIGLIFAILPVVAGALGFVHLLVAGGAAAKQGFLALPRAEISRLFRARAEKERRQFHPRSPPHLRRPFAVSNRRRPALRLPQAHETL